jgi:arylsulfatase A-like enzyme
LKGNDVVDAEVTSADQAELTRMYTEHAVDFIERHAKQPFFLYVPHSMVHVPIFASTAFAGKSGAGPYGDVVMEIDWSVGQILATLRRLALDRNTLVLFTSDNGPWLSYGNHAGNAGPLREGKGTMWEGGVRVPTIAWWPGTVPANTTCDELCATIDVLPTVAKLINAKLPAHKLDGRDISPLLRGDPHALSPHEVYWGYYQKELQMVRDRQWKLVLPHRYRSLKGPPGQDGKPNGYAEVVAEKGLYDLKHDLGEQQNLLDQYPEIAARLEKAAAAAREELGDRITNQTGSGVRPAGKI